MRAYFPTANSTVISYSFKKADLNGDKWVGDFELYAIFENLWRMCNIFKNE